MLQHAYQFSFDRLKMIIPISIVISLLFMKGKSVMRIWLILALGISSIYNIRVYNKELARFKDWNTINIRNIAFIQIIKKYIDFNCASFGMNMPVRGYDNLLIGRGIIEYTNFDHFVQRSIGCGMVYFNTSRYSSDLNQYDMATIVLPNLQKLILRPIIQADWNQFITDSNWENGIALKWSGFYLPKFNSLARELNIGDTLILSNGENRKITRISYNEQYANIDLDGGRLDIKQTPNPSFIFQLISE